MRKRSSILLAAVLVLGIGILGCGSSDKPTAPVVDTVPPAAILDLQVQVVAGVIGAGSIDPSIELTWSESPEADLAAYNVYRSANGGAMTLVGVETAATFRDGTVQRGSRYVYEVSAVDVSSNESSRVGTGVIQVPGAGGTGGRGEVD